MSAEVIDLRSDTVSRPTPAMRRAMAAAEVGDDVLGDDPTAIRLEERAAELLGKEAGLFVASGTMGNLVAQMAHLRRGQETIAGRLSHVVLDEAAGHAVVVGTSVRGLEDTSDGMLPPSAIRWAFRDPDDYHEPETGLVIIENTHAHSGGRALSPAYTALVGTIAHERGVPLHVDGARFWNAVVAQRSTGVTAMDLAAPADSVTFCLSKGLGCPVGALVVGSRDFIDRARRARKLLGGGMRQVGVLAAAGLVALQDGESGMVDRLEQDHQSARQLAEGLASLEGVHSPGGIAQPTGRRLDPGRVMTNIVLFRVSIDRTEFLERLRARAVLMSEFPGGQVRAVTHHEITPAQVDSTLTAVRDVLAEGAHQRGSNRSRHPS